MDVIPFYSEAELKMFNDSSDLVLFAFQPATNKFLSLSPAFEIIWQITRESIKNDLSNLESTIHPDDREHIIVAMRSIKREKQRQIIEFRIVCPGEVIKWVRLNAWPVEVENVATIIGSVADITTEKSYNDTLHKFTSKKNSILSILSHDLKAPLGNILMSSNLLTSQSDEDSKKLINIIQLNSAKAVDMINDFVNEEFLESSEVRLKLTRLNIVQKINYIIEQYRQAGNLIRKNFVFKSSSPSIYASMDDSKFMQVINNLMSNAVKFTPVDGTISVEIDEEPDFVLIKLKDTGIGIPEELQPFLFDRFSQAGRVGIYGEPTTGLGLFIVKEIVEWHKGKIWLESKEGDGTCFFIRIPKVRANFNE